MEFTSKSADNNFRRNLEARKGPATGNHAIIRSLRFLRLDLFSVLEIGCSTGFVLETIRRDGVKEAFGIDISTEAIAYATEHFPQCQFACGQLLDLPAVLGARKYDCVILGFYLFVVSPEKWLKHIDQALALINDGGYLLIYDFSSPFANIRRSYEHQPGLRSWKGSLHRSLEVIPHLVKVFDWQKDAPSPRSSVEESSLPEFQAVSVYRKYALDDAFLL